MSSVGYEFRHEGQQTLLEQLRQYLIALRYQKAYYFASPAAAAVAVHAAVAGNAAANAFPGPFTSPAIPRSLAAAAAAGYDGGALTITGTGEDDAAQTEVITPVAESTVQGVKIWKTVTGCSKAAVGAAAATVTLETGTKLGLGGNFHLTSATKYQHFKDGTAEAATIDTTYDGFTPTTAPNGARNYLLIAETALELPNVSQ